MSREYAEISVTIGLAVKIGKAMKSLNSVTTHIINLFVQVSHNALCEDVLLHRIPMHIVLTPTAPPTVGDDISWPDNFSR